MFSKIRYFILIYPNYTSNVLKYIYFTLKKET